MEIIAKPVIEGIELDWGCEFAAVEDVDTNSGVINALESHQSLGGCEVVHHSRGREF